MLNQVKTLVLLGVMSALVVGIGGAVAPGHLWLFAAFALATNLAAYFFSDRLVLALHRAQELDPARAPQVHAMVAELASRAGIPKPRVFLIPELQPNAFATGRNPAHGVVAVTEGIVQLLDPRELRGVLAHEIAHIAHRDILVSSIAAAMSSLVTSVAHALGFAAMLGGGRCADEEGEGGSAAGGLFLALVAPLAATLVQLGISRSREYLADEKGARLAGDPEALASALLKLEHAAQVVVPVAEPRPATASLFIVNPLRGQSLLRLFSTHPPVEERVRRLREMSGAGSRPLIRSGGLSAFFAR
ncbi:MAG: zinc metalloprotease HtpX [Deltaproteobacteria bacterium]|nr:zinc metalloprotease HtpX [Deltaproteobacteria bacterium]